MAYSTVVCPSPCSAIWTWTIYSSIRLFLCLQWSCLLKLHCQAHGPPWPHSQKHVLWCNCLGPLSYRHRRSCCVCPLTSETSWSSAAASLTLCMRSVTYTYLCKSLTLASKRIRESLFWSQIWLTMDQEYRLLFPQILFFNMEAVW